MKSVEQSKNCLLLLITTLTILGYVTPSIAQNSKSIEIENQYVKYVIGADATNLSFIDKQTGTDYCLKQPASKFAHLTKNGKEYYASSVEFSDGKLQVQFEGSDVIVEIEVTTHKNYLTFKVVSISDNDIEKLTFIDISLNSKGELTEPFHSCSLALNLQTNIIALPGPTDKLEVMAYKRFGFVGAEAAIIACPKGKMRDIMKDVVNAADDIPKSSLGGPWALDAEITRGSYVIEFGGVNLDNVDGWIKVVKAAGATTIDLSGRKTVRFGDCKPNPKLYPNGIKDLKAVVDKFHEAGIKVGLHTYAFFIDNESPMVTPVPDPRLAKDATFTLAESVTDQDILIPVIESTKDMSTVIGAHVRNSVTIQIDDELITYSDISKEAPYAFTNCQRGACGTKITPHKKGAKVYHLKQLFGLFAPDGDSTLFTEVAGKIAETYNICGFDMLYLDAIDGADIFAGGENLWHYSSKFVFELVKRLDKPAILEPSTFHHHLWYTRSRLRAWDAPKRGAKRFYDMHCIANEQEYSKTLLPLQLGWNSLHTWKGIQPERTFPDDIEYLCSKALADDCGLSWLAWGSAFHPDTLAKSYNLPRLTSIMKNYEQLRLSNYFPESVKDKLRVRGDEFTLEQTCDDKWQLRPTVYDKHKVEASDPASNNWIVENKYSKQPLQVRIEPLLSVEDYNSPEAVTLMDFSAPQDSYSSESNADVISIFDASFTKTKGDFLSGCFTAKSNHSDPKSAWTMISKTFDPIVNLANKGLGVWIYGDGQGQILNFQLKAPFSASQCSVSERYVAIDFIGWKYFELVETEDDRALDYNWPYECPEIPLASPGEAYLIYAFSLYFWNIDYSKIDQLNIWYNNLPTGKQVKCYISPIKALPFKKTKIKNPSITIKGKTITFPVELEAGSYIEFRSFSDCKVYDAQGEIIKQLTPLESEVPVLQAGQNSLRFDSDTDASLRPRVKITVITQSENVLSK